MLPARRDVVVSALVLLLGTHTAAAGAGVWRPVGWAAGAPRGADYLLVVTPPTTRAIGQGRWFLELDHEGMPGFSLRPYSA